MKASKLLLTSLFTAFVLPFSASAEERTHTEEEMKQLEEGGDFEIEEPKALRSLPDLTKGEPLPVDRKTGKPIKPWTWGPTGIIGTMNGKRFIADQVMVQSVLQGSPAEGKILPGDVLLGINGKKFPQDGHLGVFVGNAIIDAELEENGGKLSFIVWRDKNYIARSGAKDVSSVDIDKIFKEARDDNSLYDWKPEEAREQEVKNLRYDEFPIDASEMEVELKLKTFPAYSDTAPYDCPKTAAILEDAWKVLEKKFVEDPNVRRSGRGGIVEAIALIASGKPEHRKLVHEWVRGPHSPWKPPTVPYGEMFKPDYKGYKGYQSWHHGYGGLYCAIYYDATGDDYVVPALEKYAVNTALGQSYAGSWGHTFAYPSFNGGEFHKMNPGYGALNAAGNRCFFLITLAQKLGIKHPEIDQAVERAQNFFGSYADQGCIPYGDHGAYGSDDSNGKNTGVAFSLKLLGDKERAKFFAMMSSHCAFTRRGGHAHDYHGNWSSWAATLCGPEVRIHNERNLRWRRTLCRLHDGSFVYDGAYGPLRDPTATHVLHQAVYLKQTLITGKDPDEDLYPNDREMKQLLISARPQLSDPKLIELSGKPWQERSTDEVFELLDIFYPKARGSFAKELGKRYQAGEKDILPRLVELLSNEAPRYRDGALRAMGECGSDAVLSNLSKMVPLLSDPKDFVRITAVRVISKYTDNEDTQLAMLKATLADPKAVAPNSVRNATQAALFGKDHPLANLPFETDFDEELVRDALEKVLLTDPGGAAFLRSRKEPWTKDTVVKIAGPLTYIAEEEQVGDQMFANRSKPAQDVLNKFGYSEGVLSTAHRLRKQAAIPRHLRPYVGFKRNLLDPDAVRKQPAVFKGLQKEFGIVLTDKPLASATVLVGKDKVSVPLDSLAKLIMAESKPAELPSIAKDVSISFQKELDALDGNGAKMKHCRTILKDIEGKDTFRKMAAMQYLVDFLQVDALEDLLHYLNHSEWRLRDKSRELVSTLIDTGAAEILASKFEETTDPTVKAGILHTLRVSGSDTGKALATAALSSDSEEVRAAALLTYAELAKSDAISDILNQLKQSESQEDRSACEKAIEWLIDNTDQKEKIRDSLIAMMSNCSKEVRINIYYLLGIIGDDKSIATLKEAGKTDSISEFENLVMGLSYSRSRAADKLLLEFAATDKKSAEIVGAQSVRRMVLGPNGYGDITDEERMDFAEPMLKYHIDKKLVAYLGYVHNGRALRSLMYCLENGFRDAAESLITNAEMAEGYSKEEAKIAAESLEDVIEYIEVTYLRGGAAGKSFKEYPIWKALQARAGKVLLKVHKPESEPIPTFDDLDLDP